MGKTKCTFTSWRDWFRLRACRIMVDDGKVLMIRNDSDPCYYSVGDCVEHGESLEEVAEREVWEEKGRKFEVARLGYIHENFFKGNHDSIFEG